MSLSGALNAAISGLGANQKQMQVISGNVSNAGVEGYTRKIAPQSTNLVGNSTNGGVQVGEVRREVDEFLTGRLRAAESDLSFEKAKSEFYSRVQDFFGSPGDDTTLANSINTLRQKIEDLAINPENSANQAAVVQDAQQLAGQFRSFSQQTQDLRAEADLQIDLSVDKINENLKEIKELNAQIAQANAANQSSAELQDRRDVALKEISQQININTFEKTTGEIVVVSADNNARTLVDGFAAQLSFDAAGSLGSGESGGNVTYQDGTAVDADTVGGRMGALLQLREEDLANFQADMDRLAAQVREQINEAHNLATPGNAITPAGDTLTGDHRFDLDVNDGTQGDTPLSNVSGSFQIAQVDNSGKVSGSITIDLDAIQSGAAPATINDLVTEMNNYAQNPANHPTPATAGPFNINGDGKLEITSPQIGGVGGGGFVIQQDPDSPANISSSSLAPTSDPDGDGNGTRNFSHFFGMNNLFETPDSQARDANGNLLPMEASNPDMVTGDTSSAVGAGDAETGPGVSAANVIPVNQDIVDDPNKLARITPITSTGDDPLPIGNSDVAGKMAEVFDTNITFQAPSVYETGPQVTNNPTGGNVGSRQVTLSNFAGDILQFQSGRTADLERSVQAKQGVQEQLQLRADSQSGVNIDQELANLANYQQAFNANARVISVVDELFSTLNQMAR